VFSNEDYLAELLAEAGMVSYDEVAHARDSLSGSETIIEHLLSHTHLTEESVAQTLAANAGIAVQDVDVAQLQRILVDQKQIIVE
jgi:hypothetical protein